MPATATTSAHAIKAKLFHGLADPSRLAILEALRDGPVSVGEIVVATSLSQSNVSNHLNCLYDCGLVAREQQGRYVYYRLADPRVEALLADADDLLAELVARIYACTNVGGRGCDDDR